jgi:phosphoribosyl 1,2-cyclic phosphate phosphodiesterase
VPTAIVLGSGTSNGVPMAGFRYSREYLANPKNHRTRAALLLEGPTGNVLVDCPPELRLQLTREEIYSLESVIITHTHADHVMGMDDLRSFCILQRSDMPVLTLEEHQAAIRRIYPYAFPPKPEGIEVPQFAFVPFADHVRMGGMELDLFVVMHGSMPVIGLRSGGFAYVTDVSYIPPEAEAKLQGLDTLVLDAVRLKPHPNHFNLEQALAKIEELRPKKAYLTHLSHDYDHDKTNATLPPGVELACDGLRIDF